MSFASCLWIIRLCVRLYKSFTAKHRGREHMFLVFERLGKSLYSFLKKNDYIGYPLEQVRSFAYQILKAIAFCHSVDLIHTDL
jgi:serine/threonine protein kinase